MFEEYQSRYIDVKPGNPVTRRLIHTHERTLTCKVCGQTVTQHHYSRRVYYCSQACRRLVEQAQNREWVKRFRQLRLFPALTYMGACEKCFPVERAEVSSRSESVIRPRAREGYAHSAALHWKHLARGGFSPFLTLTAYARDFTKMAQQ